MQVARVAGGEASLQPPRGYRDGLARWALCDVGTCGSVGPAWFQSMAATQIKDQGGIRSTKTTRGDNVFRQLGRYGTIERANGATALQRGWWAKKKATKRPGDQDG